MQERPGCEGWVLGLETDGLWRGSYCPTPKDRATPEQEVGCVCIEGAEWGMGRRPECTDFPCTIWGPRASCWTCLGHSLPICKTRAWSRPFCFKESISGLSELPRPRHIPVGEVCQAGLKQDRVSSPPTPWRLTRFSTSSSSFIPSSSSSVRDRKGLSVPKSRYSHLTGSPRSKTKS